MPTHYTLQPSGGVSQIDAYWLRQYAGDFLRAANDFVAPSNRFTPVKCYLVGHSIELSLKAFLFTVGLKKVDRRRLNHDLEEALTAAEQRGLDTYLNVSVSDRQQPQRANRLYSRKEFEYFESLETIWDPLDFDVTELTGFAQRLYEAIEQPVWISAQPV
jgi:hypothetical protein